MSVAAVVAVAVAEPTRSNPMVRLLAVAVARVAYTQRPSPLVLGKGIVESLAPLAQAETVKPRVAPVALPQLTPLALARRRQTAAGVAARMDRAQITTALQGVAAVAAVADMARRIRV
jgi:hypothetical protein